MFRFPSRSQLPIAVIFCLYLLCLSAPSTIFAFVAPHPPQRFEARIVISENPRPSDIQLEPAGNDFKLHYSGDRSLYLLSRSPHGTVHLSDIEHPLPDGWGVEYKLMNNYLWSWYAYKNTWLRIDFDALIIQPTDSYIYTSAIRIDESTDTIPPRAEQIPPDQFTTFQLIYLSQIYTVPVIIQHTINPHFESELQSYQVAIEREQFTHRLYLIVMVGAFIVIYVLPVCIGVYIVYKVAKWLSPRQK